MRISIHNGIGAHRVMTDGTVVGSFTDHAKATTFGYRLTATFTRAGVFVQSVTRVDTERQMELIRTAASDQYESNWNLLEDEGVRNLDAEGIQDFGSELNASAALANRTPKSGLGLDLDEATEAIDALTAAHELEEGNEALATELRDLRDLLVKRVRFSGWFVHPTVEERKAEREAGQ